MKKEALLQLANEFGNPLYVYDAEKIALQYNRLTKAFHKVEKFKIHYAVKALSNVSILNYLKSLGAGLDTVSIQEVQLGLYAGFDPNEIIYTPLNRAISQTVNKNGYCFNTFSYEGKIKSMCRHRFIYECCNSIIPNGLEIDHIDKDTSNNAISNLRCITIHENRKNRDFTNFLKIQKIRLSAYY